MTDGRRASIWIEAVMPEVDGGRFAAKRIAGEDCRVEADVFKEGHDVLAARVSWRQVAPAERASEWQATPMVPLGNDRWTAEIPLAAPGRYAFTIEAWPDLYRTWVSELERKMAAGRPVASELLEGVALLRGAAERAEALGAPADAKRLAAGARALDAPAREAVVAAADASLVAAASRHPDPRLAVRDARERPLWVDRPRARAGAWYELFPRSAARGARHGTFADCEALLPEIEAMGFEVAYLPPIHPIGRTARKGRNNGLLATPEDVGSPWAIGSAEGGHTAIHAELGTLVDFRRFLGRAAESGIEVALDLAFQCSPDHPWVRTHPEWFHHRPDGTIKTAENPPKRYEDIVNFDFLGTGRDTLWPALRDVALYWIDQGVRIFRVDNPHTKPLVFWEWFLREVQDRHPDALFLSEAFTRPKVMRALAKVGFTQSYTYFTWRNHKRELTEYLEELFHSESAEYLRGNLWPNTPDILPDVLQRGGPPAFRLRVALAATLGASYGIYSGYEWCEGRALGRGEEYLDSEKYQLVDWRTDRPGDIRSFIASLNRIRQEEPALLLDRALRFHPCDNDQVLFYGKQTPDGTSQVLIAVSLDPYAAQTTTLEIPVEAYGLGEAEAYEVDERLRGERQLWHGRQATVTLTPECPAAIWNVRRTTRTERSFDYFY